MLTTNEDIDGAAARFTARQEAWSAAHERDFGGSRWRYEQSTGVLTWSSDGGRPVRRARFRVIGSHSGSTWMWAWANAHVDGRLAVGDLRGSPHRDLHAPKFLCDEASAWRLAMAVAEEVGADAVFRAPYGAADAPFASSVFLAVYDAASVS